MCGGVSVAVFLADGIYERRRWCRCPVVVVRSIDGLGNTTPIEGSFRPLLIFATNLFLPLVLCW